MPEKKLIIIGAGGHGKVLANTLLLRAKPVEGFLDDAAEKRNLRVLGLPVLGTLADLPRYPQKNFLLINAFGHVGDSELRRHLFERYRERGYSFETVVHPTAVIAPDAVIGEGAQIMAGVLIQPGAVIGENAIINTGAVVDHDCRIGAHAHIAPGAVLSGEVVVGDGTLVGSGSSVIQSIRIGRECVIAAGAAVFRDVPDKTRLVGAGRLLMAGKTGRRNPPV